MMQNPDSLLCKFFGFHLIAPRDNKEMYFTVMENTFLPQFTIHERYDLKVITICNNAYGPIICIYLLSFFLSFFLSLSFFPSRYFLPQGSTQGRSATESEKELLNESVILKDLDIKRKIQVGPQAKAKLIEQLEKDAKVLTHSLTHSLNPLTKSNGTHKLC